MVISIDIKPKMKQVLQKVQYAFLHRLMMMYLVGYTLAQIFKSE